MTTGRNDQCGAVYYRKLFHPFFNESGRSLMRASVNLVASAIAVGVVAATPLAAQNTATCDPTANTKGDIAKAQFSMTRAIAASEKGDPTRDVQEVLRLVGSGNDNPTARNYL